MWCDVVCCCCPLVQDRELRVLQKKLQTALEEHADNTQLTQLNKKFQAYRDKTIEVTRTQRETAAKQHTQGHWIMFMYGDVLTLLIMRVVVQSWLFAGDLSDSL